MLIDPILYELKITNFYWSIYCLHPRVDSSFESHMLPLSEISLGLILKYPGFNSFRSEEAWEAISFPVSQPNSGLGSISRAGNSHYSVIRHDQKITSESPSGTVLLKNFVPPGTCLNRQLWLNQLQVYSSKRNFGKSRPGPNFLSFYRPFSSNRFSTEKFSFIDHEKVRRRRRRRRR